MGVVGGGVMVGGGGVFGGTSLKVKVCLSSLQVNVSA